MKKAGMLAAALFALTPFMATPSDAACCRGKPMMMMAKKPTMMMKGHSMRMGWAAMHHRAWRSYAWRGYGWRGYGWRGWRAAPLRIVGGPIPVSPPFYYYAQWSRVNGVLVPRPVEVGPGVPAAPRPWFFFGLI